MEYKLVHRDGSRAETQKTSVFFFFFFFDEQKMGRRGDQRDSST